MNQYQLKKGPKVSLPDGLYMQTSETGLLPLHRFISKITKQENLLPGLTNFIINFYWKVVQ